MEFSDPYDEVAAEQFRTLVAEQARRNNDVVEAMCERMLTTPGDYGVLVTQLPNGGVTAELSLDVPAMTVGYVAAEWR